MAEEAIFLGDCIRTLDPKNRIVMPPAYKKHLSAEPFYMVCFPRDKCVRIYQKAELMDILYSKVFVEGGGDKALKTQRYVFSRMVEEELDSQNRFTIPQKLIDIAGIDRDVRMVGVGNRVELWRPDSFTDDVENDTDESFLDFTTDR